VDDVVERAAARLRARGERMTAPRRAVLRALAARDSHVSAEQAVADVAALDPSVHRSSVYRALGALAEVGVLQHVHLGHGATAYHLVDVVHPHGHCTSCGAVVDLPADLLDALAAQVRADSGFVLDPAHVALSGTCVRCAQRTGAPGAHPQAASGS
jgi:Fe2+ or Zn2+ uptake regulation protein